MTPNRYPTLGDYLSVLRRRKWIILLVTIAAVAAAYAVSSQERKIYAASSQVLVTTTPLSAVIPGIGNAQTSSDAQARYDATQASIAHTPPVASMAIKESKVTGVTANHLLSISSVSSNPSTNVLTFSVRSSNRAQAVLLTNALATAFTRFRTAQDEAALQGALNKILQKEHQLEAQVATLRKQGQSVSTQSAELSKLVGKGAEISNLIAGLQSSPTTVVSEKAASASRVQPQPRKDILLGGLLGLVLGIGLAFLREALDTRVRSSDEVGTTLGTGLLARIPTPPSKLRSAKALAMLHGDPHTTEPYRKLRLNLDFANLPVRARSIMVTSAVEQEGKSTTATNLAVALALAGRRVVLVDLDLRRPYVNQFFDIPQQPGVTDVMLGTHTLESCLHSVHVPGADTEAVAGALEVLPAGTQPPNPAELLESEALRSVVAALNDRADVVLVDSAPLLPVSDSVALSRHIDGILLVVRAGALSRTTLTELSRAVAVAPAPVLGFALTAAEAEGGYGYGGYYGSYTTPTPESEQPPVVANGRPAHPSVPTGSVTGSESDSPVE